MSAVETPETPTAVPPALEPPKGRFGAHRRSFASARVILALVLREMASTYGRSPGGYLWAILEPVGMILILSLGFSLLMRVPSLGNSFLLFYASGYLVFNHYRVIERSVSNSITYSRRLLLYPAVSWIDSIIARFVINLLTSLLNTVLILSGILYFVDPGSVLDFLPMITALALASLLGLAVGTANAMLSGLVAVWPRIWKIATRPLMIASAVLYIVEDMPKQAADILWWNPLVHLTGLFRTGVFSTYYPQYISAPYVIAVSMVALAFGLLFLNAYHSDIINRE